MEQKVIRKHEELVSMPESHGHPSSDPGARNPESEVRSPESGNRTTAPGPRTPDPGLLPPPGPLVALLTAGRDRPYALGMGAALARQGIELDYLGSEMVVGPEVQDHPMIHVLKIRDQREDAGRVQKVLRVLAYYRRLVGYAWRSKSPVFHILWNNKFELIDRVILMWYYRLLGKRLVFTAHNVNAGERDGTDSWLNRWSLRQQYHLAHHVFVHTQRMKEELERQFQLPDSNVTVIPFGINNTVPVTALTPTEARLRLGIEPLDKVVLFFGNIAPYKGLEYLVEAFIKCGAEDAKLRLVIAGRPKGCEPYWAQIRGRLLESGISSRVIEKIEYLPDADVEIYFKASDVVVLPYRHVFQSGVLFLGYSFGLPVIATDVGSLREEIIEGRTGYICRPEDSEDLARCLRQYFDSDLYRHLGQHRSEIRAYANDRYSWTKVGEITKRVYTELLAGGTEGRRLRAEDG